MALEIDGTDANGASRPAAAPPADQPRRAVVLIMIALTTVIFVGLFSILYVRWSRSEVPSSVLVVSVTPAFEGAVIEVSAITLPKPYVVTVRGNERVIPFYLDGGTYTLRVSRDGQQIFSNDFFINPNEGRKFDLRELEPMLPPPLPATAPAAAALVSHAGGATSPSRSHAHAN